MTAFKEARIFLSRVLPWSQPGEPPSYIGIHWTSASKNGGKPYWQGRACSTVDDAASTIKWALGLSDTKDLYTCLSSQRECQPMVSKTGRAYNKAVRSQENAVALKSFFIDLDVKDGAYGSIKEVLAALNVFVKATGLPSPSMLVASGGGVHCHWTVIRALTPSEWFPLATALIEATKQHGLLCDAAVTTDAARVLRPPDTFNRKLEQPRKVRILASNDFDYTVERIAQALEPYKTAATFLATNKATLSFEVPATQAPRAPLKGTSDLASGVETAMPQSELRMCLDNIPNTKVDWNYWNSIGMRCYGATDGADYGLEEWQRWSDTNHSIGAAKESCEAAWARLDGSPPTRTGAGALINEVRSLTGNDKWQARVVPNTNPLVQMQTGFGGLAGGAAVAPAILAAPIIPIASSVDMPPNYRRTAAGVVMLVGVNDDGTERLTPISDYPITNGTLQKGPRYLHFDTVVDLGNTTRISILLESVGGMDMRKILQGQGFMLRIKESLAQEFFVAWIQKLQASKEAIVSVPFGWSDETVTPGFVYGGKMFSPTGETQAASADPLLAKQYGPTGDLQPWLDAADMVTLQGRPELDALLASGFAGPLVKFSGQRGLLLSSWSQDSGYGKTTALSVAQAVWGAPVRTQGLTDTQNSVFGKMGQLKNLPMYWDEIKTEEDYRAFVKLAFQLTKGVEKSRMRANTTIHESGEWQTILSVASNDSMLDYIVEQTSTSPAGLMRIFEYEVHKGVHHQINRTDADRMVGRLNTNYGQPGLIYAKFLGENQPRLYEEYGEFARILGAEVKETNDERFWLILMSCLCLGAKYANQLGLTDIDEAALRAFLIESLGGMRAQRATQPNDMRKAINVSNALASFIQAMARHTIKTNRIHITAGKPPTGSIKVLNDVSRLDGIYVHTGKDDKLLRISRTYLYSWLKDNKVSRHIFADALKRELGAKEVHGRIASGTPHHGPTEYLLEINLAGNPLADFLSDD